MIWKMITRHRSRHNHFLQAVLFDPHRLQFTRPRTQQRTQATATIATTRVQTSTFHRHFSKMQHPSRWVHLAHARRHSRVFRERCICPMTSRRRLFLLLTSTRQTTSIPTSIPTSPVVLFLLLLLLHQFRHICPHHDFPQHRGFANVLHFGYHVKHRFPQMKDGSNAQP